MQDIKYYLDKYKLPIGITFLGFVLILGSLFANNLTKSKEFPKESLINTQKLISVDISGAVRNPGVYQLSELSRVEDAINAAGGFSDEVNSEFVAKFINQAQKLADGSKIYVPRSGEEVTIPATGQVAGNSISAKVNINTSNQSELESLPGIGPVTASKIISSRPYQSIDELLSKKVVGKAVYEKIKESVSVY